MKNILISILHVGVFSGMNFNNLLYKILMDCTIVLNIIDNNVEIITFFLTSKQREEQFFHKLGFLLSCLKMHD